jgi:hypothetical protein
MLKAYLKRLIYECLNERIVNDTIPDTLPMSNYRILKIMVVTTGTTFYRLEENVDGKWKNRADTIWSSDKNNQKAWASALGIPIPEKITEVI